MIQLQHRVVEANSEREPDHHLVLRIGVHFGMVLTDDTVVTGDNVNLCSRIATAGAPNEITVTRAAFLELPTRLRLRCRPVPPITPKGFSKPVELMALEWQEKVQVPTRVRVEETREEFTLPPRDTISFGRLREVNGHPANDVVLTHPSVDNTLLISRWHFELRRTNEGLRLRVLSDQLTEVDGVEVKKGDEVPLRPGTTVRLSRVLTLRFLTDAQDSLRDTNEAMFTQPIVFPR
jgi:hypothetical protein